MITLAFRTRSLKSVSALSEIKRRPSDVYFIDKVAFPTWGGAMENWGLVLYSENLLLWDPTWFETDQQLLISNVVTHELTHYVGIN